LSKTLSGVIYTIAGSSLAVNIFRGIDQKGQIGYTVYMVYSADNRWYEQAVDTIRQLRMMLD
jgi:hypothetical protein